MGTYESLKEAISSVIKTNGNQAITGDILQQTLLNMVSSLGKNSTFAGIATPSTNPGTPDQNVFYIAAQSGTYSNFGGVIISDETCVLVNINGSWVSKSTGIPTKTVTERLEGGLDNSQDLLVSSLDYERTYENTVSDQTYNQYRSDDSIGRLLVKINSMPAGCGVFQVFVKANLEASSYIKVAEIEEKYVKNGAAFIFDIGAECNGQNIVRVVTANIKSGFSVYTAFYKKKSAITIDSALSTTSKNPLENRIVNQYLTAHRTDIDTTEYVQYDIIDAISIMPDKTKTFEKQVTNQDYSQFRTKDDTGFFVITLNKSMVNSVFGGGANLEVYIKNLEANQFLTLALIPERLLQEGKTFVLPVDSTFNGKHNVRFVTEHVKEGYDISVRYYSNSTTDKSINILSIGNSYSRDALMYLPFILQNSDINVNIGILYKGGCSLQEHYQIISSDASYDAFDLYRADTGKWSSASSKNLPYVASVFDWDVVLLQQNSTNSNNYASYQPYLNDIIKMLFSKVNGNAKIGWILTPAYPDGYSGLQDGSSDLMFEKICESVTQVMNNTPIQFFIPCGTAIQNARKTTLNSLGDFGQLSYEGLHLQEGIPCLLEAYAAAITIMGICGEEFKGIYGDTVRPDAEWLQEKNIIEQHGSPVGVTDDNCRIAQVCAIMATKNPLEITSAEIV